MRHLQTAYHFVMTVLVMVAIFGMMFVTIATHLCDPKSWGKKDV